MLEERNKTGSADRLSFMLAEGGEPMKSSSVTCPGTDKNKVEEPPENPYKKAARELGINLDQKAPLSCQEWDLIEAKVMRFEPWNVEGK